MESENFVRLKQTMEQISDMELRGLTPDEERLIYICNYHSDRLLSLAQCRALVDAKMAAFALVFKMVEEEGKA